MSTTDTTGTIDTKAIGANDTRPLGLAAGLADLQATAIRLDAESHRLLTAAARLSGVSSGTLVAQSILSLAERSLMTPPNTPRYALRPVRLGAKNLEIGDHPVGFRLPMAVHLWSKDPGNRLRGETTQDLIVRALNQHLRVNDRNLLAPSAEDYCEEGNAPASIKVQIRKSSEELITRAAGRRGMSCEGLLITAMAEWMARNGEGQISDPVRVRSTEPSAPRDRMRA